MDRNRLIKLYNKGYITQDEFKEIENSIPPQVVASALDKIVDYKLSKEELEEMDEDSIKWGMKIAYDIVALTTDAYNKC